jgi:Protein of unknown function (DUF1499)
MRILTGLVLAIGIASLSTPLAIRFWPLDPVTYHAEPLSAAKLPGSRDWLVRPEGGDARAPDYPGAPVALLERLSGHVQSQRGCSVLAGTPQDSWMTFVCRSRIMGYPDLVSVRSFPTAGGSSLAIWSRARFGNYDWGVNRGRVEGWLAALAP